MPQKKSKNGKVPRKSQTKLYNYGPSISVASPALRVLLPWVFSGNLSEAAAGVGAFYSFRLNDCFDPNLTGVGLQPIGYDQYAAFYSRYRVLGTRYRVVFSQRGTTGSRVGLYASAQSTLPASPDAWIVQNRTAKLKLMGPTTGGNNVANFAGKHDLSAIFGVTRNEFLTEHDFSATTGSGPPRQCYMHIHTSGISGVVAACDFTVMLWFEVEFMAPISLSLS